MTIVNLLEPKTNLSRLVEALESGSEDEIITARNGTPAARLVRMGPPSVGPPSVGPRIGVAKGRFLTPDADPDVEAETAALFEPERS
jgi:antitoxin (DNA-binding transcriptional repressor) of toxin-antitoxin stability system